MLEHNGNKDDIAILKSKYSEAVTKNNYAGMQSAFYDGAAAINHWATISNALDKYKHAVNAAYTQLLKTPIDSTTKVAAYTNLMLSNMARLLASGGLQGHSDS